MGGSKRLGTDEWNAEIDKKLSGEFGSHVNIDWLKKHGIQYYAPLQDDATDAAWESMFSKIRSQVEGQTATEMTELDEDWAIKKRKTMKQGKRSLLSGGELGIGGGASAPRSLLA